MKIKNIVSEGDVVAFPKKHRGDLDSVNDCPKCGGDLQGGKYMGHAVKVCMPCKQVYLPPNSGIDQQGNKIKEQDVAEGQEDEATEFYVYIGSEDAGQWIGSIVKDGGKWREMGGEGTKPHNWGTAYMSYLSPNEVMQWIRQDYRRGYTVEGPFFSDTEAYDYAEQMGFGDDDVYEGKAKKAEQPEADYGDDYQAMVSRVKKLAGLGPLKTVHDPAKRVYKNVPTATQPGDKK